MKNQTAFFVLNLLAVLLSFLTGIRVLPGPDMAGAALAFYSLFILPGALIRRLYSDEPLLTLKGINEIFVTGLAYVVLLCASGFIPGFSVTIVSFLGTGATLILLGINYARSFYASGRDPSSLNLVNLMYGSRPGNFKGRVLLFTLLFLLCFTLFYESGGLPASGDSLDHVSFITRAAESGKIFPSDSYYRGGDGLTPDPRKGLWHSSLAVIAQQADVSGEYLWRVLPSFIAFFYILAFLFFARALLDSSRLVLIAAVLLFIFYRGDGIVWFTKAGYSRHVVQALVWAQTGLIISSLRDREGQMNGTLIFFAALAGTAIHAVYPLLVLFILIGLSLYILLPAGREWKGRIGKILTVQSAGILITLAARMWFTHGEFNMIHTHQQGLLRFTDTLFTVDPLEIVSSAGIAALFSILVIPLYLVVTWKRRQFKLVEVLYIVPVFFVAFPVTGAVMHRYLGYVFYRALYSAPVICFLAFSLYECASVLLSGKSALRGKRSNERTGIVNRTAALVLLLLFMFYPVRYSISSFSGKLEYLARPKEYDSRRTEEFIREVDNLLEPGSVVLSDPVTSYYMSALTDCFVYVVPAQHESPSDLRALERNRRARDFFCGRGPREEDLSWLEKEGIRYVVIDTVSAAPGDFYGISGCAGMRKAAHALENLGFFSKVSEGDGVILFEAAYTERASPVTREASGESEGDRVSRIPAVGGDGLELGEGVVFEGLELQNKRLFAGDTVRGSFWVTLEREIEFDLPVMYSLRFDTEFTKGMFYRPWYGKQYRRRIERMKKEFYRLTYTEMLRSGDSYPDLWKVGELIRQDFSFVLPRAMKEGSYELSLKVWKKSYLENRRLRDYFRNDDSKQGKKIGGVMIERRGSGSFPPSRVEGG